jgi:single-strand DNA-binding protein
MRTINKVILIGNIGNEPDVKTLQDGKKVARFSLATKDNYKDAQGNIKGDTDWHQLVAWGSIAELIENYCKKGASIYVEGKLKTRSYESEDGKKIYVTEVVINEIVFLDKKQATDTINNTEIW